MRLAKIEKFTKKYKNMYKIQITWFDDKNHDPKICFFFSFIFSNLSLSLFISFLILSIGYDFLFVLSIYKILVTSRYKRFG